MLSVFQLFLVVEVRLTGLADMQCWGGRWEVQGDRGWTR